MGIRTVKSGQIIPEEWPETALIPESNLKK